MISVYINFRQERTIGIEILSVLVRKKGLTLKTDHKGFRRNLGKYGKNNLYIVFVVTQLYSAAKASNYTTVLSGKFFNMLNSK